RGESAGDGASENGRFHPVPLRVWRFGVRLGSWLARPTHLLRLKLHGDAVDAVAQPGRRRPILEDVAQVAAAAAAVHLRADHAVAFVDRGLDGARNGIVEGGPAGAALELPLRHEQGLVTARAEERAGPLLVVERAAARRLGAVPSHDRVLLRRQQLAPLRLGPGDGVLLRVHEVLRKGGQTPRFYRSVELKRLDAGRPTSPRQPSTRFT